MVEKCHRFFYIIDMNKFETECNKYKNYLSYLTPVNILGNTIYGLTNKNKTLCLRISTFFGFEITTFSETFSINYRIVYSKNDTPLSYMGNSEFVKEEEINIVYSSDKELETNQVINEGVAFLREFKSIMDNEDTVLRNKQLEVFIKKHKIEEDFM